MIAVSAAMASLETRPGSDGGRLSSTQEPFKYEMGT